MKHDLLLLSSSTVDVILEMEGAFPIQGGCTRCILRSGMEPGGEGNLLITFRRMGGNPLPAGPLGSDHYGRFLQGAYQEQGIDISQLRFIEGYHSPVAYCVVDEGGAHSFVTALDACKFAENEQVLALLETCGSLYLSCYYMANPSNPYFHLALSLARRAQELGLPVFFDPGPLAGSLSASVLDVIFSCSSVISLNEEEAAILSGKAQPEAAAEALSQFTKALIIVKAGGRGCFAVQAGESGKWYPGFPVKTVDTMAAGDSFFGAFLYAYLRKWELDSCLTFANAAGAVKASKRGTGTQVPTFDEMVAILEKNGYRVSNESKLSRTFSHPLVRL